MTKTITQCLTCLQSKLKFPKPSCSTQSLILIEKTIKTTVTRTNDGSDLGLQETIACLFPCVYIEHAYSCFPAG